MSLPLKAAKSGVKKGARNTAVADGPIVPPTQMLVKSPDSTGALLAGVPEERREIHRAQKAPWPQAHPAKSKSTRAEGPPVAWVRIGELPDHFFLGSHLKDQPGFAQANQRVAVGQPLCAGNRVEYISVL